MSTAWTEESAETLAVLTDHVRVRLTNGSPAESAPQREPTKSSLRSLWDGERASAFAWLVERFGLTAFEADVVALCVAMELDTGTAARCAAALDPPGAPVYSKEVAESVVRGRILALIEYISTLQNQ